VIEGAGGRLPIDADAIAAVRAGRARIRQTPGTHNALGLVKFMFPNEFNVYPAQHAVAGRLRARGAGAVARLRAGREADRAGGIRAEGRPGVDARDDRGAMNAGEPRTVNLKQPIWVFHPVRDGGRRRGGRHALLSRRVRARCQARRGAEEGVPVPRVMGAGETGVAATARPRDPGAYTRPSRDLAAAHLGSSP